MFEGFLCDATRVRAKEGLLAAGWIQDLEINFQIFINLTLKFGAGCIKDSKININ